MPTTIEPAPAMPGPAMQTQSTPGPQEPAPLSEAAARALLAERFRAAGFRVRYDVSLTRPGSFAFTVDGYDPERDIGFEYVSVAERGTDLDDAERAALARDRAHRVLVMDATHAAGLEAASTSFLTRSQTPDSPDNDDAAGSPGRAQTP